MKTVGNRVYPSGDDTREVHRTRWWLDHTSLAALYRWLCDHDQLDPSDVGEVVYFLSKPWKWTNEYAEMCGGKSDLEIGLESSLREVGADDPVIVFRR